MKKIVGVLLVLAMMVSMAIPAMAAGEDTSGDYELSYEDVQWDKGYDDGYSQGHADAAAGHERKPLNQNSPYDEGKSIGYDAGYDDFFYNQEIQEGVNQAIKEAGGVPGQINVKLNDKCIAFPDAVPELKNGSTMVPVRALMEALGAKVTMDQNIVTIVLGTTSIQMAVGDAVATVDKNGSKEQVKLGAASYLKSGRVYIPLRFVSEVLGFQVNWDQDYQCVVILDRASIVKKLNERFATANIFMQSQAKLLTGNWLTEGTFSVNVEVIDSISGNKTYTTTGTAKTHSGNGAMTLEATLDLSKFAGMLDSFKALSGGDNTSPLEMLKSYMKLNHFSMKVAPKGDYYVKSELYDFMATNLLDVTLDKNKETWYRMGHMDPSLLTAEGYTVGNYLYSMMMDEEATPETPFTSYDSLMQMAASMERFMGDSRFKKQGESYVLSMNKEQVLSFAGEDQELKETLNSVFQEMNLTFSFTKDGTYSIGGAVKLQMEGLGALMNLKLDQNGTTEASNGNMQLQVRNLFNMTMKAKSTASKTQSAPDTSIPKDAQIIDFMNLAKEDN